MAAPPVWSVNMLCSLLYRIVCRQSWKNLLRLLLPSFIADLIFTEYKPTWRIHPTSYLDGLRGIASIIVFICHYTENNYGLLVRSYGLDPQKPSGWLQLPYLRIIFSGRPMVHIFFVISGFVLSYKPIKAIHVRDLDKCYTTLSSSTFRRAFRLFGPCIVSTFMIMCLVQMGYLGKAQDSWSVQFWKWKDAVFHQITWGWSWDTDLRPNYDIHLWTIPIEFAHSMLLFMVILMLSRVRLRMRQTMVFGLMIYCLTCGKWAGFEFLAGLFLAEIHLLQNARSQGWETPEKPYVSEKRVLASVKKALHISIMLVGLFIGGWPNHDADKTPGIRYFHEKTPAPFATLERQSPQKFWFGLSAVLIVWTVGEMPLLKRLFESSVAQYCGRISYAVYICHGPVLDMYQRSVLGVPSSPAVGKPGTPNSTGPVEGWGVKGYVGVANSTQLTIGWFMGLCVLGPMVIWAADLFWRGVDEQIVKIGRSMELACLDDKEESPRSQGYSIAA